MRRYADVIYGSPLTRGGPPLRKSLKRRETTPSTAVMLAVVSLVVIWRPSSTTVLSKLCALIITDKCDYFPVNLSLSTTISLCDYFALPRYIVMLSKIQFIIFSFLWLIQSHNNFGVANETTFELGNLSKNPGA